MHQYFVKSNHIFLCFAENLIKMVTADDFRDELLHNTSDAYGIDESKRPKKEDVPTSNFRKLNVD